MATNNRARMMVFWLLIGKPWGWAVRSCI